MPQRVEDEGDESWTQTLITVTPEDDAAIRRITETTLISAVGDSPLVLGVTEIEGRWTVQTNTMRRDLFIDSTELTKEISYSDAECQTYLHGVPKVELPSVYKDEASQTMYLGKISPCTRDPLRDITRIMNESIMPAAAKVTEVTQTVISFEPNATKNYTVDQLTNRIMPELQQSDENDFSDSVITDNLYFILDRVFWLSEPGYSSHEIKMKDASVQTFIKYDYGLKKIVLDADTQTSLTCEPKLSNTCLLSEWSAMKEFARDIINECLEAGVRPRTIVHSILDEVVENCASHIHSPCRDNAVQTLAPCNALEDKDDEVLRKLRLEVVLDTLESSIIVLPVVRMLLESACLEVRRDASIVVTDILNRIQNNSVTIGRRLAAIRQEVVSHKPMDVIFEARKKKLKELLRNKLTAKLCSSTQTELAGVPDVVKMEKPRETVCSTCMRHSECYVCETGLDNEPDKSAAGNQDILNNKILRTQDILIAYNPCYVVATPSKIPRDRPLGVPNRLTVPPVKPELRKPSPLEKTELGTSTFEPPSCMLKTKKQSHDDIGSAGSRSANNKLKEQGQAQGSLKEWARVVEETSSMSCAWSIRGSSSADSNHVLRQVGLPSTSSSGKARDRENARFQRDLPRRSVEALRILKNTFCTRNEKSCTDCSYDHENSDRKSGQEETRDRDNSFDLVDEESTGKAGSTTNEIPNGEGVRVVRIVNLSSQINKK